MPRRLRFEPDRGSYGRAAGGCAGTGRDGENPEPVAGLRALAQRLEQAHQESPGDAALGRCLKDVYLAIAGLEGSRDGGLEALLSDLSAS